MKKIFLILFFILNSLCYGRSLFIYDNTLLPEWSFQLVYKEKYFENNIYYTQYNFFDYYEDINYLYTETLKGIEHNVILRVGLPENYTFNLSFDFIFQKAGLLDYNNLQTLGLVFEKNIDWFNIVAGVEIPVFDMEKNPYLINKSNRLNLLLGLILNFNFDIYKFSFLFFNEENLYLDDYIATREIILTAGIDFITTEFQKVGFYVENDFKMDIFYDFLSYVYYFIPEFKISFYNDLYFIIGVEFYFFAENSFLNKHDKPQYIFKLNYIMNAERKEQKEEKEEKKFKFERKKWWQIEGVDDEMIPDSWKEMEEPRVKQ
jgi:hypothetical protein